MKSVALDLQDPRPRAAAPEVLKEIGPPVVTGQFDLHPDGTRVLVLRPDDARAAVGAPRVHATLGWFVVREAARTRTAPQ